MVLMVYPATLELEPANLKSQQHYEITQFCLKHFSDKDEDTTCNQEIRELIYLYEEISEC